MVYVNTRIVSIEITNVYIEMTFNINSSSKIRKPKIDHKNMTKNPEQLNKQDRDINIE